jgi:hypothetical protein
MKVEMELDRGCRIMINDAKSHHNWGYGIDGSTIIVTPDNPLLIAGHQIKSATIIGQDDSHGCRIFQRYMVPQELELVSDLGTFRGKITEFKVEETTVSMKAELTPVIS